MSKKTKGSVVAVPLSPKQRKAKTQKPGLKKAK